eukprot:TRINITY_DN1324_c0_g1_i4.p1 TRINITY_DN1324_c0_g1~~TRINITY_DN1324_c0_g1_i4.p1  ORF type:complete len:280 (+),score=30.79 TRINITY_DN1324_c0_g1_i4:118-957(+)
MEQLMELAGLSVAAAVCAEFPAASHPRVLVVCGPGNNGGDGLVAARHLRHFGYTPTVLYPRTPAKPLFAGLVTQLNSLGVPFLAPERFTEEFLAARSCDLVVDAIFGFSFAGPPRAPFDRILELLTQTRADLLPPILSVDVPSVRAESASCGRKRLTLLRAGLASRPRTHASGRRAAGSGCAGLADSAQAVRRRVDQAALSWRPLCAPVRGCGLRAQHPSLQRRRPDCTALSQQQTTTTTTTTKTRGRASRSTDFIFYWRSLLLCRRKRAIPHCAPAGT